MRIFVTKVYWCYQFTCYKVTGVTKVFQTFNDNFEMCDTKKCHIKDGQPGRYRTLKKNRGGNNV